MTTFIEHIMVRFLLICGCFGIAFMLLDYIIDGAPISQSANHYWNVFKTGEV